MNTSKLIYWITTALMCLIFAFSAAMYFTKTEMVKGMFEQFGYPSYIVIPLAVVKVLGIIAVLSKKSKLLMEWAYAGFFFDAVLAFFAHYHNDDGGYAMSLAAIVLVIVSRIFYSRYYESSTVDNL